VLLYQLVCKIKRRMALDGDFQIGLCKLVTKIKGLSGGEIWHRGGDFVTSWGLCVAVAGTPPALFQPLCRLCHSRSGSSHQNALDAHRRQ